MGNIIINKLQPIGIKFKENKYEECITDLVKVWNDIPEPKIDFPDGNVYLVFEYFVRIYLKLQKFDEAYKWAIESTVFNNNRNRAGESEFLIGKVAFENENFEFAKDMFYIAKKRSGGRCFDGQNSDYKNLLKDFDLK
ncbi:hypothetical protein [Leptospira meyeri]|uniref:hypothetical protein n=1 Tax=Leptospira meyeri TaxID=29508 RepID=UPI000C2AAABD|nr:hypothetical protein [Leptospira meyeri]MCW7490917.1 hypothetical protein [Leptospira meyeri]PKA23945.1 hypothetical protein CH381_23090 [Leptospira sp. mixed culture ATI2-C-A1]